MAATAVARRVHLREMTRADLHEVQRIERRAYADAWPQTTFDTELRNELASYIVAIERPVDRDVRGAPRERPSRDGGGVRDALRRLLGRGGPPPDRIVGFAGVWLMIDQLHIVTIAVDTPREGEGIGQRLLLECLAIAERAALPLVVLEVRPSNARARRIYERFGFRESGRLAAYYKNNDEDALVMIARDLHGDAMRARIATIIAELAERFPALTWDQPGGD